MHVNCLRVHSRCRLGNYVPCHFVNHERTTYTSHRLVRMSDEVRGVCHDALEVMREGGGRRDLDENERSSIPDLLLLSELNHIIEGRQ